MPCRTWPPNGWTAFAWPFPLMLEARNEVNAFFLERIDDLKRESQSHWDLSNDIYIYIYMIMGNWDFWNY